MNTYLIIANILTGLAFIAHTFMGDQELKVLMPSIDESGWLNKQEKWTMARCGWHWISFDLLMATLILLAINFTTWVRQEVFMLQLMTIYFSGYAVFWLVTIIVSKSFAKNYLKLGQWILLIVISALLYGGTPR